jgi:pimeloyl-ACP methyl ester carboxylesterase
MGSIVALYYLFMRDPDVHDKYLLFGAPLRLNWLFFLTDLKQPHTSFYALFNRNKLTLPVKDLLGDMTLNAEVYERIRNDSLVPETANINYILTLHGMLRVINARLNTVGKDILFFYGENDALANLKKITKQNRLNTHIRTIVVPEERHSMFWADKETYRPAIAAWLAGTL